MYLAIFFLICLFLILNTNIYLNVKSANDTIKIDGKVGLIRFVIPHQRLLSKLVEKQKNKSIREQKKDFKRFINSRQYLNRLFKHSSLNMLYIGRFTKEELYLNPILNGIYLITSNQIKSYLSNHFKKIDNSSISLVYDEKYENLDYYLCIKTDIVSLLAAIIFKD